MVSEKYTMIESDSHPFVVAGTDTVRESMMEMWSLSSYHEVDGSVAINVHSCSCIIPRSTSKSPRRAGSCHRPRQTSKFFGPVIATLFDCLGEGGSTVLSDCIFSMPMLISF